MGYIKLATILCYALVRYMNRRIAEQPSELVHPGDNMPVLNLQLFAIDLDCITVILQPQRVMLHLLCLRLLVHFSRRRRPNVPLNGPNNSHMMEVV